MPKPPQRSKLFNNLLKTAIQLIKGRSYTPSSQKELMEKLNLPERHADVFKEVLSALVKEGSVKLARGKYICTEEEETNKGLTGTIKMHFRGFGFVKLDDSSKYSEDIFIPKHLTMNAVDGDSVEVIVNEIVSEKGPEGRVTTILSRNRTHIAGTIIYISPYQEILAHVPLLGQSQRVVVEPSRKRRLKEGDRVVMEVLDWGSKETETLCRVSDYLGHIEDASCDIKAAIREFELRLEFPSEALKEAESLGSRVSAKEIALREDLRAWECVTIDPDTAKDFDDAITLTKDENGRYLLGVHIADVSHYIEEGSAIDKEAKQRCNSTYFPGTCLPMLPKALSENLCSLKPQVNRLTVSVFMEFDSSGELLNYRISRTVIKSAKRFSYREAKAVLDGTKKSKHAPLLHRMVELCGLLKIKRYERGSLEFSLPDLIIVTDEKGMPTYTEYVAYDVTHQMIEEFMLKANETIAWHLCKQGRDVAYRVHDEPSEDNMKEFAILANSFGFNLSETPSTSQLQELFDEALQTPYGQYLATSYIRKMRQALYSTDNIGHYGLGLNHYCHFTSPIRRYIDLVIHRLLFDELTEASAPKKLEAITLQCSEQERISAKAENSVNLLKKLRLLDKISKEDPQKQYEAVVTRVKMFGFSFEVLDFLLEGFLHVSALNQDYFVFHDETAELEGVRTGQTYCSGDRITLMLQEVDFILLESKWHLVPEKSTKKKSAAKEKRKKKHQEKRQEKKAKKRKKNQL